MIHQIEALQGLEIRGPVEQLCDLVAGILEKDAQALGVELLASRVEVSRTGYARCTPTLGLTTTYGPVPNVARTQ